MVRFNLFCCVLMLGVASFGIRPMTGQADTVPGAISADSGLHPNLAGQISRPMRYRPEKGDFIIENGVEFFNRSLYGGNTAFRVDGGDKPEFSMYLPGRGGNLRLGIKAGSTLKWLKDASYIMTRYRPGELIYEIRDQAFGAQALVTIEVLAYADTEGFIVRAQAKDIAGGRAIDLGLWWTQRPAWRTRWRHWDRKGSDQPIFPVPIIICRRQFFCIRSGGIHSQKPAWHCRWYYAPR